MWQELEERVQKLDSKELRTELLRDIDFVLENLGQPRDYYKHTNPNIIELNERLDKIRQIRYILFDDDKEKIMENLFSACDTKEEGTKDAYKRFYVRLCNFLNVWPYGDEVNFSPSSFGGFASLKDHLWGARTLLELGYIPLNHLLLFVQNNQSNHHRYENYDLQSHQLFYVVT